MRTDLAPAKMPALDRRSLVALIALLVLCLGVGIVGGAVTRTAIEDWYATLAKPVFSPPNWIFAPVWTVLYILMAVAAWRIWRTVGAPEARRNALRMFGMQLLLNLAWPFIFFGAKSPLTALIVILVLEFAILWTMLAFARLDRTAAWLMAPYAAWVAWATALNAAIVALN